MAKRETFAFNLECPKCKRKGTVTWSENENPIHGGGLDRSLEELSIGFKLKPKTETIICVDCNCVVSK